MVGFWCIVCAIVNFHTELIEVSLGLLGVGTAVLIGGTLALHLYRFKQRRKRSKIVSLRESVMSVGEFLSETPKIK